MEKSHLISRDCSKTAFSSLFHAVFHIAALVAELVFADVSIEKSDEIVYSRFGDARKRLFRQKRLVGRDDDIRHGQKPRKDVVLDDVSRKVAEKDVRFLLIYVETRRADLSLFDAVKKRFRVDERTARCVEQNDPFFEFFHRGGIDEVFGFCRERTMQAASKSIVFT